MTKVAPIAGRRARGLALLPRTRVSPLDPRFVRIFRKSEPWPEVVDALSGVGRWSLIKDVPISLLSDRRPSVDDYACDGDEDGVNRCQMIALELEVDGRPWPLLVSGGFILDGYHRLAVVADRGDRTIDVLWTV